MTREELLIKFKSEIKNDLLQSLFNIVSLMIYDLKNIDFNDNLSLMGLQKCLDDYYLEQLSKKTYFYPNDIFKSVVKEYLIRQKKHIQLSFFD